jgi:hypothetical protein
MKTFIEKYGTRGASLAMNIAAQRLENSGNEKDADVAKVLREMATDLREALELK